MHPTLVAESYHESRGHTAVLSCISTANGLTGRGGFLVTCGVSCCTRVWSLCAPNAETETETTCTSCFSLLHPQPFPSKQTLVVFIRLFLEKGNRIIGLGLGRMEPFFSFCSIITTVYINWSFNKSPSNSHSRCSLRLGTIRDHRGFHKQFCIFLCFPCCSVFLCFLQVLRREIIVCFLSHLPCLWRNCTPFWSFQHFCGQSLLRPLCWECCNVLFWLLAHWLLVVVYFLFSAIHYAHNSINFSSSPL